MDYLTEEEQYKEILDNEEISRIRDIQLKQIRHKFWLERHKVFLDEKGIKDQDLGRVYDEIWEREKKAIEKYKTNYG